VPVFDITKYYQPNDTQDFLVCNQRLGAALAAEFGNTGNDTQVQDAPNNGYPAHNLILMRSHGFAAVAPDIKTATYQGIYAVINATVQSEALKLRHAHTGQAVQGVNGIACLDERQIRECWATESRLVGKPWALWVREVRANPMYVNELSLDAK
jgi:hypothetical protein